MISIYKDKLFLVKACNWYNLFPDKLKDQTSYPRFRNQLIKHYLELFGKSKELLTFDKTWKGCKDKATAK